MNKIDSIVNSILEGKEIKASLMEASLEDEGAYYEVVYGYYMSIVHTDQPTTDMGAVIDVVIDNLEAEGNDGLVVPLDQAESEYNEDEYVVGGNHSLALIHNGNFDIREISKEEAQKLNADEHVDIYNESFQIDEGAGRLASVKIVDEPYGKGVEVKDSNGAVYRYAVDTHDPKYYTPEKVKNAVLGLAKRYNYDMGRIYQFLKTHTLGDYDKDVSNRAGLDKSEIVVEPEGEGLKVTLDNGQVYRYTVDQNDEKYNTLELLKNGVDGMWRHGGSVDGILSFLDNHAMLYAREEKEADLCPAWKVIDLYWLDQDGGEVDGLPDEFTIPAGNVPTTATKEDIAAWLSRHFASEKPFWVGPSPNELLAKPVE